MSGKGSRIPCSKTYFVTRLSSDLTLDGPSKEFLRFLRLKPRPIRNPTAADDSAIPTAPNINLFSPKDSPKDDIFIQFFYRHGDWVLDPIDPRLPTKH